MALTNRLDASSVKSYIANVDGKHNGYHDDGEGLHLLIKATSAQWFFRFSWAGKQSAIKVADAREITLKDVRAIRKDLRAARAAGINPRDKFTEGKVKAPTAPPPAVKMILIPTALFTASRDGGERPTSFPENTLGGDMLDLVHHREGEKKTVGDKRPGEKEMIALMQREAPTLLAMETAKLTRTQVLEVVLPLWETKRRSAEKVVAYGRMCWRHGMGINTQTLLNPFGVKGGKKGDLMGKGMLRPGGDPAVNSRQAMPWAELPAFMLDLLARPEIEARALELLLYGLTPRTEEVLLAKWEQFNLIRTEWNIPGDSMKGWEARTIPLCPHAVDLLLGLKPIGARPGDWVFPSRIECESGRLSDSSMQILLRDMRPNPASDDPTKGPALYTVHGFRSTLLDWVGDENPLLLMAAEKALDHKIGGKVLQVYLRTGMVDNRRGLADLWSAHLAG